MNPLSSADQQIVFFLFFALYFSLASTRIIPMNNGNYLTPAFELSLKVYNKVFRLANSVNMTADQQQEYNDILAEQPQVVADKLKNALNIDVDPQSVGQIGLFFLKGPMNQSETEELEKVIVTHHLHVSKHLVMLFKITPDQLNLQEDSSNIPLAMKIQHYLFNQIGEQGENGKMTGRTSNDYLNSVNTIYALIRSKLSDMAYNGQLNAKQTIYAKKIIHVLNKESVEAMVKLLNINDTSMSPNQLIEFIKSKRTDDDLDQAVELKIKEVVYMKKLEAINSLVLLLHMKRQDIDIPNDTPQDLIDVIFTPGLVNISNGSTEALMDAEAPKIEDFFCMSCFHKAYSTWKIQNGFN